MTESNRFFDFSSCSPPGPFEKTNDEKGMSCVGCASITSIRVHYGAPSCHGCKAFFRRSMSESRRYVCSSNNNCDTTREARNRCRACRLRRCVEGGMKASMVREERVKTPKSETGNSDRESPSSQYVEENPLTQRLCYIDRQSEQMHDIEMYGHDQPCWRKDIPIQLGLQNPAMVMRRTPLNFSCQRIMNSCDVYQHWYRGFVQTADWAMNIDEFASLPPQCKIHLFKINYLAVCWLTHCYKCYEYGSEEIGLSLGNGSYIPYRIEQQRGMEIRWAHSYGTLCRTLINLIVKPMCESRMTHEEYCLLKCLCLFQCDGTEPEETRLICNKIRERLLDALATHITLKFAHLSYGERTIRASKLPMLMSPLSDYGKLGASLVQNLTSVDLCELSGVPREILNYHTQSMPKMY